jgi:TetR/AcrR family transcriptional regulator, cholesterol catabolism regulator
MMAGGGVSSLANGVLVGEPTRERILRLADHLFARHGYAGVSMREVAGAAGVTKPALYYHFRDKEALFEECVLAGQRRLGGLLRNTGTANGSLRARVAAVAHVLLTESDHAMRVHADVADQLPGDARGRLDDGFRANVVAPVEDLFSAAAERGQLREGVTPAVAASALLGLVVAFLPSVGSASDDSAKGSGDPAVTADLVARLVLDGVVGLGPPK